MSTLNEKKLFDKIQKLNLLNKRQEAIELLLPHIKDIEIKNSPRLFVKYAFLLYHVKLPEYSLKRGSKKQIIAEANINKAQKILQNVIALDKKYLSRKDLLSSKVFLAQIYAITKNKKAISLAKNNYKNSPSVTTANRLADVYFRLGDIKKAKIAYEKYENLLIKNKMLDFVALGDLAVIFKSLGDKTKADEYFKKALPLMPKNEVGWCMSQILSHNGFPIKIRRRL